MKVIFLDIDGVLNCQSSTSSCGVFVGIDNDKVKRLREIVDATEAKIVLSSSWRMGWSPRNVDCDDEGRYLNRKLRREGLHILDKTGKSPRRPMEVYDWLQGKQIESFVILDDEDWNWGHLSKYFVKTEFYDDNGGLQAEHVAKAIEILNASKVQVTN